MTETTQRVAWLTQEAHDRLSAELAELAGPAPARHLPPHRVGARRG